MEKTIKELKFEKAWACAMLAEIRSALKDGRTLKADTVWQRFETGDTINLLDAIDGLMDNIGAKEAEAEQTAIWEIGRLQRKAGGQ